MYMDTLIKIYSGSKIYNCIPKLLNDAESYYSQLQKPYSDI